MNHEELRGELRRLAAERERISEAEAPAVVAALKGGVKQADIARDLQRTREHIRRIARDHGIEATK